MFRKLMTKPSTLRIALSCLVSSVALSALHPVFAGSISAGIMKSTGPCAYSLQLQSSVAERRSYLTKLSAATNGSSAVEDMYNNITPAAYNEDDGYGVLFNLGKTATTETIGMDSFSKDCLTCHDGGAAVGVEGNLRNDPFRERHTKSTGSDHPIGMDYERYVAANSHDFKSVWGAGNKMVFINGRVGCLTCHDPLNPEREHLVMSDRNSALCRTCHDR